jgi:hypothetical protein
MPVLPNNTYSVNRCRILALAVLLTVHLPVGGTAADAAKPLEVGLSGRWLVRFLDKLDVEHHWLRGRDHVAWKTGVVFRTRNGQPLTPRKDEGTHCSAFAAAVSEKLGVKLLCPPDHSLLLLANAQYDWLESSAGRNAGWTPVDKPLAAQEAANAGQLVLAVCKNPDPTDPGHIAVVRPSKKSPEKIAATGPQVTQAGFRNYKSVDLKTGFVHHPEAWRTDGKPPGVKFYAHAIDADKLGG